MYLKISVSICQVVFYNLSLISDYLIVFLIYYWYHMQGEERYKMNLSLLKNNKYIFTSYDITSSKMNLLD